MFLSLPFYFCFVVGWSALRFIAGHLQKNLTKLFNHGCTNNTAFQPFFCQMWISSLQFGKDFCPTIFSSIPRAGVLPVRLRSAPSTIFGCEDESLEAGLNLYHQRTFLWMTEILKNLWVILDRIYEAIKLKGFIQKYSPHKHLMWIQSNAYAMSKQNINKWNSWKSGARVPSDLVFLIIWSWNWLN